MVLWIEYDQLVRVVRGRLFIEILECKWLNDFDCVVGRVVVDWCWWSGIRLRCDWSSICSEVVLRRRESLLFFGLRFGREERNRGLEVEGLGRKGCSALLAEQHREASRFRRDEFRSAAFAHRAEMRDDEFTFCEF